VSAISAVKNHHPRLHDEGTLKAAGFRVIKREARTRSAGPKLRPDMHSILHRPKKRRMFHENYKAQEPRDGDSSPVVLSILAAPLAKAQCGAAHNNGGLSPALRNLQGLAVQGDESAASQAVPPQSQAGARNGSEATILGVWKMVLYAGGELNDE